MMKQKSILFLISSLISNLILTSCAPKIESQPLYCEWAKPMYYDAESHLTPRDKANALKQYKVGHDLCGWPSAN